MRRDARQLQGVARPLVLQQTAEGLLAEAAGALSVFPLRPQGVGGGQVFLRQARMSCGR